MLKVLGLVNSQRYSSTFISTRAEILGTSGLSVISVSFLLSLDDQRSHLFCDSF